MTQVKIYRNSTMTTCYSSDKASDIDAGCTVKIDEGEQTIRVEYGEESNRIIYEGKADGRGFRLLAVQGEQGEATLCWLNDSALVGDWSVENQRGFWRLDLDG